MATSPEINIPEKWCQNCGSYVISDEKGDWIHLNTGEYLCRKPMRGKGKTAEPYQKTRITYAKEPDDETGVPRLEDDGS